MFDEDIHEREMEADMAVGLATMNCLNCSTILGSKANGGVKSVLFSTEECTTQHTMVA